jgi:uncharacterized membrane protein YdjX (TVP38/TMEM64 family)
MILNSSKIKILFGSIYLLILFSFLFFLFSYIDLSDLTNYEFLRANKDSVFKYKNENFVLFSIIFFVGIIFWNLLLGAGTPTAIVGGFIFGKWFGTLIIVLGNTAGATLLYYLTRTFFSQFIQDKLSKKFSKFIKFINKNELLYFMCFRFIGGGGAPFPIQSTLPVVFNMSIKNYIISTLLGIIPTTFVTVALGSGIESIIEKNSELSFSSVFYSPEIYMPIIGFFILLLTAFILKKIFFK